jgi:hypothetical protein
MELKLSTGLEKLIDVIAQGVGAVAKPWMMKRVARAEAECRKILAAAQQDIDAQQAMLKAAEAREPTFLLGSGDPALLLGAGESLEIELEDVSNRVERRVSHREARRQFNIETIVLGAADAIREEPTVSTQPVDEDWIARFFSAAQEVSNAELQAIWSRLLAQEVAEPNSVPLRTIEVLRNLTTSEARLFASLRAFLCTTTSSFLPAVPSVCQHVGTLREAGLVGSEVQWSSKNESDDFFWKHAETMLRFRAWQEKSGLGFKWRASGYPLTSAGESIVRVSGLPTNPCRKLFVELQAELGDFLQIHVVLAAREIEMNTFIAEVDGKANVDPQPGDGA